MTTAAAQGVTVSRLRGPTDVPPTPDRVMEALRNSVESIRRTVLPILEDAAGRG
jgi:hypothetical protein